jgi:hypothetical protein
MSFLFNFINKKESSKSKELIEKYQKYCKHYKRHGHHEIILIRLIYERLITIIINQGRRVILIT